MCVCWRTHTVRQGARRWDQTVVQSLTAVGVERLEEVRSASGCRSAQLHKMWPESGKHRGSEGSSLEERIDGRRDKGHNFVLFNKSPQIPKLNVK